MAETSSSANRIARWCLESTADGGKSLQRVPIQSLPFRIGRLEGLDLTLPFKSVSKRHAEIYLEADGLKLRDLESTNGTFVNRKRVTGARLQEGDILHFAEFEFRLGRQMVDDEVVEEHTGERGTLALGRLELSRQFVGGTRELGELLELSLVDIVFQPIVTLPAGDVIGYEVLGRGLHEDLPANPAELFRIAETVERAPELSRLFRSKAVELVLDSGLELPLLFLNTHPAELGGDDLVTSLKTMREMAPALALALEIHEGALAAPQVIAELKTELDELDIKLAYDDFGLGERLLELAEVPPHYLKFDIRYVKGLDEAPASKRRLLSMLMAAAREVNAHPIAEGIETEREAEVCAGIGFTLAQGYLYSRPISLCEIATRSSQEAADQVQDEGQHGG